MGLSIGTRFAAPLTREIAVAEDRLAGGAPVGSGAPAATSNALQQQIAQIDADAQRLIDGTSVGAKGFLGNFGAWFDQVRSFLHLAPKAADTQLWDTGLGPLEGSTAPTAPRVVAPQPIEKPIIKAVKQPIAKVIKKSAPRPAPTPTTGSPWKPGPGQLQGADTSNWQSLATFNASIQSSKFTVIKASQGTGYTDPTFKSRWALLGQKVNDGSMKLRMAYGFLNPGDGVGQAKHFLDVVGVHGRLPAGTRLVLDWEGPALNSPSTLRDAANYIHQVTGTWPLIYVQGSKMAVAKATVPNAPIWEAAYGSSINKDVPFFQYSDGPGYDHDVFNGDVNALAKFAGWA